ncbi:MAG: RNA polymerase sigma factor [Candidatus Cloacimonadales bacterium]|nr:RNA polymerase sigma factor [Candidatus Cloacimonadales bacterium]
MEIRNFESILRKENKRIFNYLLKMLRNKEDAEDIMQETFIAFHRKMDVISEEALLSYLYRTAHNKALNLIKKRKRQEKFSTNYEEMEHLPEEQTEEEEYEKSELVRNAFRKISAKYALILEMQFYRKMSYKEIAAVLEISESAVDSRLVRAKKKLKKIISQEMKTDDVLKSRGEKNETEEMQIFA